MAGHGHGGHEGGDKRIALLISILALFLAVAETGAKSAQTEALSRNVEASNLWAFFQAKTIRQTTVSAMADLAELERSVARDEATREAIQRQQATWRGNAARWESEPATGEGRRELAARAQSAESRREKSMSAYHLFESSSAAFQVAIVLSSASIVTGVAALALGGAGLGAVGLVLGLVAVVAPTALHL